MPPGPLFLVRACVRQPGGQGVASSSRESGAGFAASEAFATFAVFIRTSSWAAGSEPVPGLVRGARYLDP